MRTEPRELDRGDLTKLLAQAWGLTDVELEYLPVGFGSHHWRATDGRGDLRFVTGDDLEAGFQQGPDADSAFAALERAYRTAVALRSAAELEFVVAPLPARDGAVLRRLGQRFAVSVLPFVDGAAGEFRSYEPVERRQMGRLLGRLHAATARLPDGLSRTEDFALASRAALLDALRDLDRPWASGPFAERARQLLRGSADHVERLLAEYDRLVAQVAPTASAWVVTHGEPHGANVIRDLRGDALLVDWDTTLLAPRERDLRFVLDDDLTGWEEYREQAGAVSLDGAALRLYRLGWDLADIAIYTRDFRRPHEETEDTVVAWRSLTGSLTARESSLSPSSG